MKRTKIVLWVFLVILGLTGTVLVGIACTFTPKNPAGPWFMGIGFPLAIPIWSYAFVQYDKAMKDSVQNRSNEIYRRAVIRSHRL